MYMVYLLDQQSWRNDRNVKKISGHRRTLAFMDHFRVHCGDSVARTLNLVLQSMFKIHIMSFILAMLK